MHQRACVNVSYLVIADENHAYLVKCNFLKSKKMFSVTNFTNFLAVLLFTDFFDKIRLSCLVRVSGVNRIGDKSRLSATGNFETVLSSLEMQRRLLKTVLTCRQVRSQDKTRQLCLVRTDCVNISPL